MARRSSRMLSQNSGSARARLIWKLGVLAMVLCVTTLLVGPAQLSIHEVLAGLFFQESEFRLIIWELRLPRLILSLSFGAGLGACGAAAQALTRNPLADPALFGAPQAAAFGAVLMLSIGAPHALSLDLPLAAIGFSALSMVIVMVFLASHRSIVSVLLVGVGLGSLFGAGTSLLLSMSANPFAVTEIVFWLLGSFSDRSFIHVGLSLPFIITGCMLLFWCAPAYRALSLGEDTARTLGYNIGITTAATILGIALTIGAGTAVVGSIGFVGLIAPHLVRSACGGDPSLTLLPSCLAGACITIAADISVKCLPSANEVHVGVITAIIGAPFLLYIAVKKQSSFSGAVG